MNNWYALNLFVASLTVLIVTVLAWRRRNGPGGRALVALGVAIYVWTLGYAFYWYFSDPQIRSFFFNIMISGMMVTPLALLFFSLRYTNHHTWLRKRIIATLSIIPLLSLIFLWTDPWHQLFSGGSPQETLGITSGGIVFWIDLLYTYALALFSISILLQAFFNASSTFRSQLFIIIISIIIPIALSIAVTFGFDPLPGLDLTPIGFVASCICITIALSRYHFLDLIPIARSSIVDELMDGCLVLDSQHRVIDANKAAQIMLSKKNNEIIGKPAEEVFAAFSDLYGQLRDTQDFHQQIEVPTDPVSYYDIHITPLHDPRGGMQSRLVTFRNVTEHKNLVQAEHEQRVLAEALRDTAAAMNQCRSFAEVLDRILDNVGRVVPFDLAGILLAEEGDRARLVRTYGYTEHGLMDALNKVDFSYQNLFNFKTMVDTGSSIVIPDTSHSKSWKVFEGLEQLHSYVGSPIRIRNIVIGFLELISFSPGFYSQAHADRLQAFADQSGIALENARLLEQAQQRTEELSSLLEIGMAVTSGVEMSRLLAALLEKMKRVFPIEALYVATYDNDSGIVRYPLFYDRGDTIEVPAHHISDSPGLTGQVILSGQLIYINDTLDEQTARTYHIVQLGGEPTRSYVGVPLKLGERVVGAISMQSSMANAYHPAQVRLLETIATQTAGAIESARLYEEIRQHAEEMTALFDIGITITSGLDMEQVLKGLLEKCKQVLPVEAFYTGILDPETNIITHPLAYDNGEYLRIPPRNIRENPGLSGHIIKTRQTLYIPDITAPDTTHTVQIFRTTGTPTRSYVGVPMIIGNRVVGIISMQSYQPDAYDPPHIRLLETIASQAAIAIENSRLYAKAQQELTERTKAEVRYRALFEQSHDAVFIIGFDGKHLEANRRATELLGYSHEEICNLYVKDVTAEAPESEKVLEKLLAGAHVPLYERKFRRKDGKVIVVEINVELVRDTDGTPLHIQSVVREITERKVSENALQDANEKLRQQLAEINELQKNLRELAIRDPLTGLFNRRFLEETLDREFAIARRQGTTVCLVMMDIDGFKGFNDTHGHDAGDFLLRKLGELLHDEIRRSDISCRYGGEEFLLVMPGVSLEKGKERAERLRRTFSAGKYQHMGTPLTATLSIGVAIYPTHGATWQKVLHAADKAMYAAKEAGRDKVVSA